MAERLIEGLEPLRPEWFQGGTRSQKGNVARGLHPLGSPLLGIPGHTCGSCVHAGKTARGHKKCRINHTHGAATDIRWKWAACMHYERSVAHGQG